MFCNIVPFVQVDDEFEVISVLPSINEEKVMNEFEQLLEDIEAERNPEIDKEIDILLQPFSPARCEVCWDYYSLNPELFYDCPSCDRKAWYDLEIRSLLTLHLQG